MRALLMLLLLALCVSPAEARRWYRAPTGSYQMPEDVNPALQSIAQARAEVMAAQGVLSHGIGSPAPPIPWQPGCTGEGIGCARGVASYREVGTCIVGSVVVADGWAKSGDGMIYRVRFFR